MPEPTSTRPCVTLIYPEGVEHYPLCPDCGHRFGVHCPGLCPACVNEGRECRVDAHAVFDQWEADRATNTSRGSS